MVFAGVSPSFCALDVGSEENAGDLSSRNPASVLTQTNEADAPMSC